ncbi:MAG: Holliday junction resolvase RuvX [Candidatus Binataceae bacterium]
MPVAGIDFGRKRVGLAITDGQVAYPLGIVERRSLDHDLEVIRSRLAERGVSLIVVGLPLNMDGTEGPSARAARSFAEHLGSATGLAVEMFDERLTSFEAEERLKEASASRKAKNASRDAVAAVVILEGWLESRPTQPNSR